MKFLTVRKIQIFWWFFLLFLKVCHLTHISMYCVCIDNYVQFWMMTYAVALQTILAQENICVCRPAAGKNQSVVWENSPWIQIKVMSNGFFIFLLQTSKYSNIPRQQEIFSCHSPPLKNKSGNLKNQFENKKVFLNWPAVRRHWPHSGCES